MSMLSMITGCSISVHNARCVCVCFWYSCKLHRETMDQSLPCTEAWHQTSAQSHVQRAACFLQTHVSFACQPTPWKPEGRSVIATETSSFARPGKLCKSMSLNLAPQLLSNDFLVERSFKGPGILDGPAKRVIVLCFLSRPNVAGSLLCLFHSGHPYGATSASCRSRATPSPFRTKSSCIHRRPLAT